MCQQRNGWGRGQGRKDEPEMETDRRHGEFITNRVYTLLSYSYSYSQRYTYRWVVGNVIKGLWVQCLDVPAVTKTEKKKYFSSLF